MKEMTTEEKIKLAAGSLTTSNYSGYTQGIPRLEIPAVNNYDGLSGFRASDDGTSTQFPSAMSMASTWDPNAVYKWAATIGKEFHEKNLHSLIEVSYVHKGHNLLSRI